MNVQLTNIEQATRRHFMSTSGIGLGAMALSTLSGESVRADVDINATQPLELRQPHFRPKAKRIIYLHLTGSPPNLDCYDYKPELIKRTGED